MESEKFYDWLIDTKKLSNRAAKDVISRCKRVCNILGMNSINDETLSLLIDTDDFNTCSMFIKSQLKRAVYLYTEFEGQNE